MFPKMQFSFPFFFFLCLLPSFCLRFHFITDATLRKYMKQILLGNFTQILKENGIFHQVNINLFCRMSPALLLNVTQIPTNQIFRFQLLKQRNQIWNRNQPHLYFQRPNICLPCRLVIPMILTSNSVGLILLIKLINI